MKKAEHKEQVRILTIGFAPPTVARMRRFKQPENKYQTLYDYFLRESFRLFFFLLLGGGDVLMIMHAVVIKP